MISMITSTDNMRVIGGTHRGRRLRTVSGLTVRPTSDRLRETLFNVLAPRIIGSRFLDICAGSGAVGIEALSRGSRTATFIERSREACAVIEANLNSLGIGKEAIIMNRDALMALKRLEQGSTQFDLAFFDPPYASEIYGQVMTLLGSRILLSPAGLVIVEHRAKSPFESAYGELRLSRELKQGESALAFYETRVDEI